MSVQRQLLEILMDGNFHSGEKLASSLGVTRAAIWKNIKILESKYELDIHALTGKGYRLSQSIELLDSEAIIDKLTIKNVIPEVETFLSIDSTNRYLMKKVLSADLQCHAVFAEQQTSGRGRHGRSWVSPFGGNLYFSVLYPFQRTPRDVTGLSLAVGVAIVEQLEQQGIESAKLKWPNDILVNGRKLCGILLELHGESHGPFAIVVGVGINISMPENAAREIDQPWVAYQSLTQTPISRNQLAASFLSNVLLALQEFERDGLAPFRERWLQRDCYMNSKVKLQLGDREITGIARGIDQQGALLLESQGQVQRYYSGEIHLRPAK